MNKLCVSIVCLTLATAAACSEESGGASGDGDGDGDGSVGVTSGDGDGSVYGDGDADSGDGDDAPAGIEEATVLIGSQVGLVGQGGAGGAGAGYAACFDQDQGYRDCASACAGQGLTCVQGGCGALETTYAAWVTADACEAAGPPNAFASNYVECDEELYWSDFAPIVRCCCAP